VVSKVAGKLSYSNVTASLALFVALSAGAYAAVSLDKDSVRSRHIKDGQVNAGDLNGKLLKNVDEARLKVSDGFLSGSPFFATVKGYVRTEIYCDDNGTPGIANDDNVSVQFKNLLGEPALATSLSRGWSSPTNEADAVFPSNASLDDGDYLGPAVAEDRVHHEVSLALPDGSKGVLVEVFAVEESTSAECYAQVHSFPSD